MESDGPDGPLGMSEAQLYEFLDELLQGEAIEAAAQTGNSIEEELGSPGFAAAAAANSYAIKLIMANNAYITRQLLDLGVLPSGEE
jgi:hypothetical protein